MEIQLMRMKRYFSLIPDGGINAAAREALIETLRRVSMH